MYYSTSSSIVNLDLVSSAAGEERLASRHRQAVQCAVAMAVAVAVCGVLCSFSALLSSILFSVLF